MSLPAPSNVMPPSSETFKMSNELLDENIRMVTSKMDKVSIIA
jgi:hypothetical protein